MATIAPEQVFVRHNRQLRTIGGTVAILLPPYSIVEWNVMPGDFYWETLYCDLEMPGSFPGRPVVFPSVTARVPSSREEINEIMTRSKGFQDIGRREINSAIADKVKSHIDAHYMDSLPISAIANTLRCSHAVMTRSFKDCFGLTPVAYRSRLRVTDSLRLLLMHGYSVSEAAFMVGFEDLSQYNRHFRKQNLIVPSVFRPQSQ